MTNHSKIKTVSLQLLIVLICAINFESCTRLGKASLEVGGLAPEIETSLIDGEEFTLSSLKGNWVLIDFWGSWCGPCHQEMPDIVNLENMYSSKGLQVLSIALEKRPESWKKVVERYGMNWKNQIVRDNRYVRFDEVASSYGVTDIPAKFLLDDDGKFILLNPTMTELQETLKMKYPE